MKRGDGRAFNQLREVKITPGYLAFAEGSVLIEMGKTHVICAATVDERVPPFLKGTGKGWVTAEYSMLPRATSDTLSKRFGQGRVNGRSQEIQQVDRTFFKSSNRPGSLSEKGK